MKKNNNKKRIMAAIAAILIITTSCCPAFAEEIVPEDDLQVASAESEENLMQAAEEAAQREAEEAAARAAAEAAQREAEEAAARAAAEAAQREAEEAAARAAAEAAQREAEEAAARAAEEAAQREAEEAAARAAEEATAAQQTAEAGRKAEAAAAQQETETEKTEAVAAAPQTVQEATRTVSAAAAPAAEKLDFVPVELKTQAEEVMTAGNFYLIPVEIKNITNQMLEKAEISLRSKDRGYVITPYKDVDEAWEDNNGYYTTGIVAENHTEKEDTQRVFHIRSIVSGDTWKNGIVIWTNQDITLDEQGLEAEIICSFQTGTTLFTSDGTWKLKAKEKEILPVEEPTETQQDTPVEEPTETQQDTPAEEPTETQQDTPAEVRTEEPFIEDPENPVPQDHSGEQETPQEGEEPESDDLHLQEAEDPAAEDPKEGTEDPTEETPQETNEDEIVTVDVIPDDGEETYEDEVYYDDYYSGDWGYYSGVTEETVDTATPYVLVKSYGHKKTISTGDTFALEITFLNTSQKIAMENVVIKVETSDALSLASGTNTLFVSGVGAGATNIQRINLLTATECKDPTQKVDLSITYEYLENKERKQGTAAESITIPITQKDRLELRDPVYDSMEAGKEGVISISYVNKGYTSLYNMEAALHVEGADAVQNTIYAGNVESGKTGTLDFVVTPYDEGDYTGTVTLTYEDSTQKEVSIDVPIQFNSTAAYVEEYVDPYYEELPMEEPQPEGLPLVWILAGAGVLVLAGIITGVVIHKKKKARKDAIDADDWFEDTKDETK